MTFRIYGLPPARPQARNIKFGSSRQEYFEQQRQITNELLPIWNQRVQQEKIILPEPFVIGFARQIQYRVPRNQFQTTVQDLQKVATLDTNNADPNSRNLTFLPNKQEPSKSLSIHVRVENTGCMAIPEAEER